MDVIRRCQNGETEAFAGLFEQYKNLVYRTAVLMLDNPQEAEDALQDVFIQVIKSISSFSPAKGAFTTWLHRITVNSCLNRRRRQALVPLSRIPEDMLKSDRQTAEERLMEDMEAQEAIRCLSGKLRAVVVLRFYWDLSYAEIARTLNIPIGTVQSRLNLAIKVMRDNLKDTGEESLGELAGNRPEEVN